MSEARWLDLSERWLRLLVRLYPPDFRDEMGDSVVEAYRDRCRYALRRGGIMALIGVWGRALVDSVRNGPGERVHPAASWRRSGNWGRDTEVAVRRLVRAPVFSLTMIGTLMIGLGAFAVVYTVVDRVLLEPMPYEQPDDLYYVWRDYSAIIDLNRGWLGGTDVAELQQTGGVIEDAVALQLIAMTLSGRQGTDPTEIPVMLTSPELFDLLGVRPALGRGFTPDEVGPGRAATVVLTHELWSRLGADASIIGSDLRLDGEAVTVIGVMPPDFRFVRNASLGPPQGADAFMTFDYHLAETNPNDGSYAGLIRARAGTAPEAVLTATEAVGTTIDRRDFEGRGVRMYAVPMKGDLISKVRPALVVLGLAGGFLVLVLMVNLATLLLARAAHREQEFAVSRALGANRLALVRATLLEGGLLGLIGGAGSALLAVWGTKLIVGLAPLDLPRRDAIGVGWDTVAVVSAIGLIMGLLAALVPAVWATRTKLSTLMSSTAVRGGGGHGRMRRGMVVVQVAMSLVLLSTGGLVVRSFDRLLRAEPGFDASDVLTVVVPVSENDYPEAPAAIALHDRIEAALAAVPGVTAVGAATALPLTASANQTSITFPGAPGITGDPEADQPLVDYMGVRRGYFETLGIPILAGRDFGPGATGGSEAIIDRTMAAHFFPTGNPIGAQLPFADDTLTVVGVVEHARLYDLHLDGRPQLYLRATDEATGYGTLAFAVRSSRRPDALVPEVRAAIRRVDPQLALTDIRTMDDIVDESVSQQRLSAVLIGGFSLGALLLAAMGLFGIVSASVLRRRHELAIRLALGADHGGLLCFVMSEGAALIGLGVLIGLPGVYMAGRAISGTLIGISPFDGATLIAVALGLGGVALIACYLPARRVLGIQPAQSLRQQ